MAINKKHIAHLIHRFDTGGLENGLVNLINQLDEQSYFHSVITLNGYNPEFCKRVKTSNVAFYDLNKAEGQDLGMFVRLNKLLKDITPDVFHTRNLSAIEGQLVGWWRNVPLRIHGEHGWGVNDLHGSNKKYQRLRRFFKPMIHQYVALSTEAKDYLLEKIGVPSCRINHICNGVDTQKFRPDASLPEDIPEGFSAGKTLVFGTVGRLADVKNQAYLLSAFAHLVKYYPKHAQGLRLLIVGGGGLMDKLQAQAKKDGILDRVWFTGDRSDIDRLMRLMDVFVLPSLAEGISNTLLEAMASGLPVVATKVGGNPELLYPSHHAGNLVATDDTEQLAAAMAQYFLQPGILEQHSQENRVHCCERFSIRHMVEQYHHLYQVSPNQGQ
ncbi:TIGR03088 family PEP-CTERM/XrtA system glycosyltransferase [Aliiglaciecola sp. CAU 1673]|uniref:TIGR03088 family PEP-CTERM/XrtA system glycosyltransferase n=1 Tax=Aliiglaciecola sp. CAU 1673 TaxID=3032595 RepID=UPI0023DCA0ED|nr:TIGR03088 family PEP-CTERM/XrtA system glycosyltransferase [Aliiglaciecola sp. CAU 1673]MDF2177287.1 TIGR03088 family PEP-CTERM/XrtA system glycosyltransferase [Aliiglaciecola sp. CAU 1673]